MSWSHPQYLVETGWLAANLEDPALRVLECTTILHPLPDGGYKAESGRASWAAGHGNVPARAVVDPATHAYLVPRATSARERLTRGLQPAPRLPHGRRSGAAGSACHAHGLRPSHASLRARRAGDDPRVRPARR